MLQKDWIERVGTLFLNFFQHSICNIYSRKKPLIKNPWQMETRFAQTEEQPGAFAKGCESSFQGLI